VTVVGGMDWTGGGAGAAYTGGATTVVGGPAYCTGGAAYTGAAVMVIGAAIMVIGAAYCCGAAYEMGCCGAPYEMDPDVGAAYEMDPDVRGACMAALNSSRVITPSPLMSIALKAADMINSLARYGEVAKSSRRTA